MSKRRVADAGRALCLLGAALGGIGLIGWLADLPSLTTIVPGQPAMKPNPAVSLILLGLGAALRRHRGASRALRMASILAALVVLAAGIMTLAEYALSIDLHIDGLVALDPSGHYPGRMSPPTAVALCLLASALLVFDVRPTARARPSEWLALSAGFVAFVALLGQAFGAGPTYRLPSAPVVGVSVPAAVALFMIATGMLLERPGSGVMRVIVSSGPGGTLVRRFVPAAILAPILANTVLKWLFAFLGLDEPSLMAALLAGSLSVLGLVLLSVTVAQLDRAHRGLESSRAQISKLVEQAPDGIFIADLAGRYREVNDAGCRLLGYSRDEILEKTILDLIPSEDVGRLWQSQQRMLGGRPHVDEWVLQRKDGTPVPVEVSATILPDGRWQGIVRDISERKQAQEKLREASERIELALRGADLGAWDWNVRSGEVIFNARWAEMRGYRLDEIGPQVDSFISGIHPDDRPRVQGALDDYFQGRSSEYQMEMRVRTKSGQWIWILDRGKVFGRDEHGQPVRMVGTELDITERKRIEEALRLAEARSSGILSISADAIISIDEDQRITRFNEGAEKIFGYAKAEVIGSPLDLLIAERLRGAHQQHLSVFAAGEATSRRMGEPDMPIIGRRRNGEEFPADASISKLEVGGQRIFTVALHDVTERKQLEDKLRAAVRSRDDVLGVVAHDLRSPLSTIMIQAQGLGRRQESERAQKLAASIERAAKRMNRLIQDLLDVTRIEAGHLALGRGNVLPGPVVSEVVDAHRPLATSGSIELQLDLARDLPDVLADRDRLAQVFENLIGNALKFTEPGGRITVGAAPRDGEVLFWVADTGSGIAAEHLPHVFDRFWQVRTGERHGAGLGLQIVKGIVEAHEGRVWVDSTPGKGSIFYFTIPVVPRPGASPTIPGAA